MQKAKVNVLIVLFAYSGNGGIPGTIPALVWWVARTYLKLKTDERVDKIGFLELCDTPITMTRNRAIAAAQAGGFDMVLMLDSDNQPDGYLDADPTAKPFWDTAFDLAYGRLLQGKPTVAMAPYCGPPQHPTKPNLGEVPYMFHWLNDATGDPQLRPRLEMLNRNDAARMRGIHPVGAGPTGVSLFTVNAFEGLPKPYFAYDWNHDHSDKASTEDVYCTRNISLFWTMTTGENPVFGLFDCWALHHKVKLVGRPTYTPVEAVSADLAEAIRNNLSARETIEDVNFDAPPQSPASLSSDEAERILRLAKEAHFGPHDDELPEEDSALEPGEAPLAGDEETPLAQAEADDTELSDELDEPLDAAEFPVVPRRIGRRKVFAVGPAVPTKDLRAIEQVGQMHGKDRVLLVHPWSGEVAAALLAGMPPKATLYVLDQAANRQAVDRLAEALKADFASGRIKVLPATSLDRLRDGQDLDLVFLATSPLESLSPELLSSWRRHVSPHGVLAGLGYSDDNEDAKAAVLEFSAPLAVSPRVVGGSSVWLLPEAQLRAAEQAAHAHDTVTPEPVAT